MKTSDYANLNASDELEPCVQVPEFELEPFVLRLKGVIGDRKVREFARRAGVNEATLRATLSGSEPRVSLLAAIARASGKTLDWLVFGKEGKVLEDALDRVLLRAVIEAVEEGLERSWLMTSPEDRATIVLAWYDKLRGEPPDQVKRFILSIYPESTRDGPGTGQD